MSTFVRTVVVFVVVFLLIGAVVDDAGINDLEERVTAIETQVAQP